MDADSDFIIAPKFSIDVPHLQEYFGLWHIYEQPFRAAIERYNGVNLYTHIKSEAAAQAIAQQADKEYPVTKDGIAVFNVSGPMMKYASSMSGGTSTVRLRQQVRLAKRDPEVAGGFMVMDTPGGTVSGNFDLAQEIAAFAAVKPIFQFTEDMCASAGVSLASQATMRFANNGAALYGSMGTYGVLIDASGRAEQLGLKVHVIKAGDHKGTGQPGTEITAEQLDEMQRIINAMNDSYVQLIATGLNKSVDSIKALADGRVHPASDALKMGLIDGIKSRDEAYIELVKSITSAKPFSVNKQRSQTMADKTPASVAELKKQFPKSTAEWREQQLEAGASIHDAALSYATFVEERADAAEKKHKLDLETAQASKGGKGNTLGHAPVTGKSVAGMDHNVETGDGVADFNAAVQARLPAGVSPTLEQRMAAISSVARNRPDLHLAMLKQTNSGSQKVSRLLDEKYEGKTA